MIRRRRDEARHRAESEHECREPDVALEVVRLAEAVVEGDDEEKREQDLHSGERKPELLQQLLELSVELFLLRLLRHARTLAPTSQKAEPCYHP